MEKQTLNEGFVLSGHHDYVIQKAINCGGFGITYLAKAEFMDHHIPVVGTYAIKEFFPEGACHRDEDLSVVANDNKKHSFKESLQEFKEEADCLHDLHHDGIVPVNEVIETNGTVYYVMKYLEGQTLEEYMTDKGGHLSEKEALEIVSKVGDALDYLHQKNILHLDVKPDNIMMVGTQPILIDFGCSRKFKPNGQLESKKKGIYVSDGFSPEEQYKKIDRFSPKADIYALGATLYNMLTGEAPVVANEMSNRWIYNNTPEEVSNKVIEALCHAMAKDPEDRTESVRMFLSELTKTTTKGPEGKKPPKKPTRKINGNEDNNIYKKIAIAAAILAACIVAFLMLRPSDSPSKPDSPISDSPIVEVKDTTQQDTLKQNNNTAEVSQDEQTSSGNGSQATTGNGSIQEQPTQVKPEEQKPEVQKPEAQKPEAQNPEPTRQMSSPTLGRLDLGYAVWEGDIVGGQPDGNGTMSFKSSHRIESRDIDANMASPGDKITGTYKKGHLVYGTWKKSNGETTKLMIGE